MTYLPTWQQRCALLDIAFRPFFLLSALYGLWLLLRWALTLSGHLTWAQPFSMFAWHAYEFQFGYAFAVVMGFLLTAAKTWTGQDTIKGFTLGVLVSLWLIARIAMNTNIAPLLIAAIADTLAMLLCGLALLRMLLRSKNYRNMVFVPILLVFASLHLTQLWSMAQVDILQGRSLGYATSWWFTVLISLIASRVIPFFTSRALKITINAEPMWFTIIAQLSLVIVFIQTLYSTQPHPLLIAAALACHCWRLLQWHDFAIWKNPLLWSLWLSYSFLPLALLTMSLNNAFSTSMHLINLGFIASMIVAFSSRVSLGHTGHALKNTPLMTLSFVAIISAALVRGIAAPWITSMSSELMTLSAVLWMAALICYLLKFSKILALNKPS